ncbi:hypothetical protein HK097_005328 [Rhizophlyctis rosea]|uniref:Uncharacterized protein n=1 Tax=Rhizophlyctis rosea TaxID=64517 RepID=A0AAD5SJW8_9FUNG|nr:hypothetical protein HK097_005328 [Rhizophlyctis rosea]
MFGAFRPTFAARGGLVDTRKFYLTTGQKLRLHQRLARIDDIVDVLVESGAKCRALEAARRMPKLHELSDLELYWVHSKRYKNRIKPISWVPKWTKVPHPREWKFKTVHDPTNHAAYIAKLPAPGTEIPELVKKKNPHLIPKDLRK